MKGERFDNVWDALADTPEEAANLTVRSDLMFKIEDIIERNGWSQKEAAEHCGVSVPRINALLKGHIDKFSLDALVNIAAHLGQRISIELSDRQKAA
ncbi:MAG: XRE family transcriptional regulator [Parvibaculum sp.]